MRWLAAVTAWALAWRALCEAPACSPAGIDGAEEESLQSVVLLQTSLQLSHDARAPPASDWAVGSVFDSWFGDEKAQPPVFEQPGFNVSVVGAMVFLCLGLLVIGVHEACLRSRCCSAPLLALPVPACASSLRWVLILGSVLQFIGITHLIPLSYDLTVALGVRNPGASSGLLVGLAFFGMAPGGGFTKLTMPSETEWDQRRARRNILLAYLYDILVTMAMMLCMLVPKAVFSSAGTLFWAFAVLAFLRGCATGYQMLSVLLLGQKITLPELRNDLQMFVNIGRNLGFMIGPAVSAVAIWLFRPGAGGSQHTEQEETMLYVACTSALYACLTLGMMLLFAVTCPTDVPEEVAGIEDEVSEAKKDLEVDFEAFPDEARKSMVIYITIYSVERALTLSGLEVASLMMYENLYGWPAALSGLALTTIAAISVLSSLLMIVLLRAKVVGEASSILTLALASGVGAVLLFDVSRYKVVSLLVADAIIFSAAMAMTGLTEGWVSRAVKPNSSFSNEIRLPIQLVLLTFGRLLVPALARVLITIGGRNAYAMFQAVVIASGLLTIMKVMRLRKHPKKDALAGASLVAKVA